MGNDNDYIGWSTEITDIVHPKADELYTVVESLIKTHSLNTVLETIVKVLRKMKNPEYLVFQLYLFGKRALREIAKGNNENQS